MYQRFWLLAAIGGCTTKQKSQNAAAVGADGVLELRSEECEDGGGNRFLQSPCNQWLW